MGRGGMSSMLQIHGRAALIPIEPSAHWYRFLLSRFIGTSPGGTNDASLALVVQSVSQQSATHAGLSGLMEYGSGVSLPVVFECSGTVDLETREIAIHESNQGKNSYTGSFSENGRVITLCSVSSAGQKSKPLHLIHEKTLTKLLGS